MSTEEIEIVEEPAPSGTIAIESEWFYPPRSDDERLMLCMLIHAFSRPDIPAERIVGVAKEAARAVRTPIAPEIPADDKVTEMKRRKVG